MHDNSVVFNQVSFSYEKEDFTVKDLSFEIKKGSFCSIIGKNGSGKTTVAKLICGLLEPQEGQITTDGYAGLIFQNPQNQMVGLTVEEEVAFGLENMGIESSKIREKVFQVLKDVKLNGLEKRLVETLSGGQVQALAIAGVLAMDSKIIVCDESLSMLDASAKKRVLKLLHNLCKKGKTVVYITNEPDETADSDMVMELK